MLAHTVKSVVKSFHEFCGTRVINLKFVDPLSKMNYDFTIKRGSLMLTYGLEDKQVQLSVVDIEMLQIPASLDPVFLEDSTFTVNGGSYEDHILHVSQEVQIFVKLFKIMRERVCLTIKCGDEYIDCYYLDGKLIYVEETEDKYTVVVTNLFSFYRNRGEYSILTLGSRLEKFNFSAFMSSQEKIANRLGKTFSKSDHGYEVR